MQSKASSCAGPALAGALLCSDPPWLERAAGASLACFVGARSSNWAHG